VLLALGALGILFALLALGTGDPAPLPLTLGTLGTEYAAWLALSPSDAAPYAPLYGAALLLACELAYAAADLKQAQRVERRALLGRGAAAAASALAGAALGASALLLADVAPHRTLAITIVGAAAVAGCAELVRRLARSG